MNHVYCDKEIPNFIKSLKFDECKYCINCKIFYCKKDYITEYFVYFYTKYKELFENLSSYDSYMLLKLTCEEMQIKLLLE